MNHIAYKVLLLIIFTTLVIGCGSGSNEPEVTEDSIIFPGGFDLGLERTHDSITVSWSSLAGITGATEFELYGGETGSDLAKITTLQVSDSSYTHEGLTANTEYTYYIKALDDQEKDKSSFQINISTLAEPDTEAPGNPSNLGFSAGFYSITLSWNAPTDSDVSGYKIYNNNVLVGTITDPATTSFTETDLAYASSLIYKVSAYDTSSNESSGTEKSVTTLLDNVPPSKPVIQSSVAQALQITLNWSVSTDNDGMGVAEYKIFIGTTLKGTTNSTTQIFTDTGLEKSTNYSYTVVAYDAAGNQNSSEVYSVSTSNSNLTFKTFPSQINLSWTDAENSESVTYKVHRDSGSGFEVIASTIFKGHQDRLLNEETSYTYKITYDKDGVDTDLDLTTELISTTKRKIKLEVYENSGNTIASYPVQAFVPLPYGVYQQSEEELKSIFIIKDNDGVALPAQYWVRSRWHARDNSIKEMVVVFLAKEISANAGRGNAGDPEPVEFFLEHGVTPDPTNIVSTSETATSIVVSNADVEFTINKDNFNFLDSVSYKGIEVINNSITDGAYIDNRFGTTYRDSQPCTNLAPTIYEVEESGPVRARIRVERPAYVVRDDLDPCYTQFPEIHEPVPGFVVWFDLYSDSEDIHVNYNLLNNAITPFRDGVVGDALRGWPLFYEELGINLSTPLVVPLVKIQTDTGEADYTGRALQESESSFTMSGSSVAVGSQGSSIKVMSNDQTGFAVLDPLFQKTFPNGWEFNADEKKLTYLFSPDGCTNCEGYNRETDPSNSGLYVVNDLSLQEKRFTIKLFDNSNIPPLDTDIEILYSPPSIVLSTEDYSSIGTSSDLFGIAQKLVVIEKELDMSFSDERYYKSHQQTFGLNFTRYSSCATGGIPYTAMDYLMVRPPQTNRWSIDIYDDLKRPQLLPKYWAGIDTPYVYKALQNGPDILSIDYVNKGHLATEFSSSGYCKNEPIRAFFGNVTSYQDKTFPVGYLDRKSMTAYPRDHAHLWMQQLSDVNIDNPMLSYFKDRYEQHMQAYSEQLFNRVVSKSNIYETAGDEFPEAAVRGIGNSLITLVDLYMESGDDNSLYAIEVIMDVILDTQLSHGGLVVTNKNYPNTYSFQEGYMMDGVINAMSVVPVDHPVFKKGWSFLFGGGDERAGLPGILDAMLSTQFGNYDYIGCRYDDSLDCKTTHGTNAASIDPATIAVLLLTVKNQDSSSLLKAREIVAHLVNYLDKAYGGMGPYFFSDEWRNDDWNGMLYGRASKILSYMNDHEIIDWIEVINHKEGLPFN